MDLPPGAIPRSMNGLSVVHRRDRGRSEGLSTGVSAGRPEVGTLLDMPPRPHRPDALTWQVFRGSDAVRDGLLTEHQLRSAAWVRLRHDIYADARLDRDHALACRAALLRLSPGVVIGGPSAAYLHGVEHAATFTDDVHILVPRPLRIGAQRGLRVHVHGATPDLDAGARDRSATSQSPRRPPGARHSPGAPRSTGASHAVRAQPARRGPECRHARPGCRPARVQ